MPEKEQDRRCGTLWLSYLPISWYGTLTCRSTRRFSGWDLKLETRIASQARSFSLATRIPAKNSNLLNRYLIVAVAQ